MKLIFWEERNYLRKGALSANVLLRLPRLEGGSERIESCYRQAAEAFCRFGKQQFLPRVEAELADSPRSSRLHLPTLSLAFLCEGSLTQDRYLSLTLTVIRQSPAGREEERSHCVWDGTTGLLCPIDRFLSPRDARGYDRWHFLLQGENILALPKKQKQGEQNRPICVGARDSGGKIFRRPIDKAH